ncbi:MAG: aminotransferase class I/II-fold pyridoxal phosphate-dependent enzyme [Lachnospiraceae bacterium]|nr:aminotransferase class I/II-fold pyridoxal phosphate-dependent enzyme [Lachnospiraceae bacterium]
MDFSVNLNPCKIPDSIRESMKEGLSKCNAYPDIRQRSLLNKMARALHCKEEQLICGNGASELIMAYVRSLLPQCALLIRPCFSGYEHALGSLKDCRIKEIFLEEKENFRVTDKIAGLLTEDIDVMFLTDPWNPVGHNIEPKVLERILKRAEELDIAVLLDISFLGMSEKYETITEITHLIKRFKKLCIIGSFTKLFSLPGIRMGYALSDSETIGNIRNNLPEWNLGSLEQTVMEACTEYAWDREFLQNSYKEIEKGRKYLKNALTDLGFELFPSDTSFLLIKGEENLCPKLLERKILIRDCGDYNGLCNGMYRIAVKDMESNETLIRNLKEVLNGD